MVRLPWTCTSVRPADGLGEQLARVTLDQLTPCVEVQHLDAGPRVGSHLLRAVASLHDPEPLDLVDPGPEMVEEHERPAGPGVEGPVEEVLIARLGDARPGRAGVEDAPRPRAPAARGEARIDPVVLPGGPAGQGQPLERRPTEPPGGASTRGVGEMVPGTPGGGRVGATAGGFGGGMAGDGSAGTAGGAIVGAVWAHTTVGRIAMRVAASARVSTSTTARTTRDGGRIPDLSYSPGSSRSTIPFADTSGSGLDPAIMLGPPLRGIGPVGCAG